MPVSLKWLCRLIAILSENSIRCLSSQKEFVLGLALLQMLSLLFRGSL